MRFLRAIDANVPDDLDVHRIVDNDSTHKTPQVQRWLAKHPRFQVHHTPTYSAWINRVERWFALLSQRKIKRASQRSARELEHSNDHPKPSSWTKSADQILASVRRCCQYTLQSQAMPLPTSDSGN